MDTSSENQDGAQLVERRRKVASISATQEKKILGKHRPFTPSEKAWLKNALREELKSVKKRVAEKEERELADTRATEKEKKNLAHGSAQSGRTFSREATSKENLGLADTEDDGDMDTSSEHDDNELYDEFEKESDEVYGSTEDEGSDANGLDPGDDVEETKTDYEDVMEGVETNKLQSLKRKKEDLKKVLKRFPEIDSDYELHTDPEVIAIEKELREAYLRLQRPSTELFHQVSRFKGWGGFKISFYSAVSVEIKKGPERAGALKALAKEYCWKPILPEKLGYVEFHAQWLLPLNRTVLDHEAYFNGLMEDPVNKIPDIGQDPRNVFIELGSEYALPFHIMQAWWCREGLYRLENEVVKIPSRMGRLECLLLALNSIVTKSAGRTECDKMTPTVDKIWKLTKRWGDGPHEFCGPQNTGSYLTAEFETYHEFWVAYTAARGAHNLHFLVMARIAAQLRHGGCKQWLSDTFVDQSDDATIPLQTELRVWRDTTLEPVARFNFAQPSFFKRIDRGPSIETHAVRKQKNSQEHEEIMRTV